MFLHKEIFLFYVSVSPHLTCYPLTVSPLLLCQPPSFFTSLLTCLLTFSLPLPIMTSSCFTVMQDPS